MFTLLPVDTVNRVATLKGYAGSIIFFMVKGQLKQSANYEGTFLIVMVLSIAACICSVGFLVVDSRKSIGAKLGSGAAGSIQEPLLLDDALLLPHHPGEVKQLLQ